jgi:hypothetical protein
MSDNKPAVPPVEHAEFDQPEKPGGPNLTLIYSLIVLAMLAAIAFAVLIVLPYYNHR